MFEVMITATGVYLVLAVAILFIIAGGVFLASHVNKRRDR